MTHQIQSIHLQNCRAVRENWELGTNQFVVCRAATLFTKSAQRCETGDLIALFARYFGVLIQKKSPNENYTFQKFIVIFHVQLWINYTVMH